ncbi:MAG: L,D-transpeptidase [Polyangiaceae bacterium]
MMRARWTVPAALAVTCSALLFGCNGGGGEETPQLSKGSSDEIPNVPVPPADGPRLGAISFITKVMDRPSKDGQVIGHLHAGAMVPRAEEPYSKDGCEGGWYPIRPRGFVCAGEQATTELSHPTLIAMAQQPKLDDALPYAYARTTKTTPIYQRDPADDHAVQEVGKIRGRSGLAIVGSWSAKGPEGDQLRLGMMTDGRFVKAADLKKAEFSDFKGVELGNGTELPVAFVVKRGVRAWQVEKGDADKQGKLEYHQTIMLTGKYREVNGLRYWETSDNRFVRHRDVTVIRRRENFPEYAKADERWIDISIVTGSMVLYEGTKPVYTTLVSVGRNRLDEEGEAVTKRGDFKVTAKFVSATTLDPTKVAQYWDSYDTPWVIQLDSGQHLHGAYWHDRFGIEHTNGDVHLTPYDANHVFRWITAQIPDGWNSVLQWPKDEPPVHVVIRK